MSIQETISLTDEVIVSVSSNQVSADLGTEVAILNVLTGTYHGLDEVGNRVWALVQSPISIGDVKETILVEYEVDAVTCDRDLKELFQALSAAGLIEVNDAR